MSDRNQIQQLQLRWPVKSNRLFRLMLGVVCAAPVIVSGCGPSQEELMMRAAQRTRPKSIDEKAEEKIALVAAKPVPTATINPGAMIDTKAPDGDIQEKQSSAVVATKSETEDASSVVDVSVAPISERSPETPLSEVQRIQRAVQNLNRISEALIAYKEKKGHYPPSANAVAGMKTLSWRVLILPDLGYQDLYAKFDLNTPWNREPNKSLLSRIPDEFVSPERFDTKTNWMLPSNRKFLFGEGRYPRDRHIEDGVANTVMLLEVNDGLAVEWTKPTDFDPSDFAGINSLVGGLRPGGTLACWANGWPTLLPGNLSSNQWLNALTHEAGDGQTGGSIHREVDTVLTAAREQTNVLETAPVNAAVMAQHSGSPDRATAAPIVQQEEERLPVPASADLLAADERAEQLFRNDILQAARDQTQADMARELIDNSKEMSGDPAGAFALQAIAMEQAIAGGDFDVLQLALNIRGEMFDVDRYPLNRDSMIQFMRKNRDLKDSTKLAYVTRAIVVLRAGLEKNDFDGVAQLAASLPELPERKSRVRGGVKLVSAAMASTPDKTLRLLQGLVATASRDFGKVAAPLAAYRQDPGNREAASAIGRFYCFIKGDWDTGLPLVIDGTSRKLSDVARKDLSGGQTSEDQVRLGDMWFEVAGELPQGVYRQGCLDRAEHWYTQAFEVMPESLDRLHVQARLNELAEEDPGSPLAAIRSLAEQLRLDPDATLQNLTSSQSTRGIRRSDPDDDYEDG